MTIEQQRIINTYDQISAAGGGFAIVVNYGGIRDTFVDGWSILRLDEAGKKIDTDRDSRTGVGRDKWFSNSRNQDTQAMYEGTFHERQRAALADAQAWLAKVHDEHGPWVSNAVRDYVPARVQEAFPIRRKRTPAKEQQTDGSTDTRPGGVHAPRAARRRDRGAGPREIAPADQGAVSRHPDGHRPRRPGVTGQARPDDAGRPQADLRPDEAAVGRGEEEEAQSAVMTDAEAVQWRGRLRRIQNDPEPFDTQTLGDVVLALLEAVLVLRDQVRTIGELATSAHLTAAEAGRVAREAMAEADRAVERVLEAGRRHSSGVLH